MERNVNVNRIYIYIYLYNVFKTIKNIWCPNPFSQYHTENYPEEECILPLKTQQCEEEKSQHIYTDFHTSPPSNYEEDTAKNKLVITRLLESTM